MPRIAIGIPVFNEDRYIAKTLESVLSQFDDYSDLDVFISDNGSSDNSVREIEATLDSFGGRSSAIRLSKQATNLGVWFNFWHVYEATDSEYFLWIGAHDQISKGYVSRGMGPLERSPEIAMFCGKHQAITSNGQVMEQAVEYDFSQPNPAERYLRSIASLENCYILQSIFRRSVLEGLDYEMEVPSFDHVIISRMLWSGRLIQSPECSYLRRYFQAENRQEKAQSGRYVNANNNIQFFEAYLSDLEKLAMDLPSNVRNAVVHQASAMLIKRFGIPFIQAEK